MDQDVHIYQLILNLNCCQDCLVMAEAEDVCDLRIKQGVDDWEHLEEKRIRIEKSFQYSKHFQVTLGKTTLASARYS